LLQLFTSLRAAVGLQEQVPTIAYAVTITQIDDGPKGEIVLDAIEASAIVTHANTWVQRSLLTLKA
jgi:hypothetical protein